MLPPSFTLYEHGPSEVDKKSEKSRDSICIDNTEATPKTTIGLTMFKGPIFIDF